VDPESRGDRWVAAGAAGLVVAGGAAVGAAVGGPALALAGAGVAVLAGLGLGRLLSRRARRRRALVAPPFPGRWRRILTKHSAHYRRLPPELRDRFETDVRILVAETRITGVEAKVTEPLRLLVAASAATLSVGWPRFEWSALREVLLYPRPFDRDYRFGRHYAGMAHPSGTVILSIPALRASFATPDDGYHSGYHEFAHLLDLEVGPRGMEFDGLPVGLDGAVAGRWEALRAREMDRLRRGASALDAYAATDPVEFFAVAVETFFERPVALRTGHPELYGVLAAYFRQDPAAWETGRGGRTR
jgi:MtfA peptidase